jgi:hypothetical protein
MISELGDHSVIGSAKGTRTDNSMALTSLASGFGTVRGSKTRASDELELRLGCAGGDSKAEVSADAISAISIRSGAATIKKTQKWEVSHSRW